MDKKQESKRRMQKIMAMLFLAFLLLIFVLNIIKRDREYSEQENRMLAQKPKATVSSVTNGRFMKQYEEYQSDQFVLRNFWVTLKAGAEFLAGKKESNGVFRGKDGYLLEDVKVPEEKNLADNLEAMKAFQGNYPDVEMSMLLVPNAVNMLKNKLPALAQTADQKKQMEEVKETLGDGYHWIDAAGVLSKEKEKPIYYKTDHHWTSYGAYQVFLEAANALGIETPVKMKAHPVTTEFNGALAAASGYRQGEKETIQIYLPETENKVVVNYVEEQRKTASMYDSSKLKERDKYGVFFGGNYPLIQIKTTSESNQRLLVVKDSYANCFVPFLTTYYREIVMVDPRYFYGDIEELMVNHKVDQVLFLYNANTFFEDNSIHGVFANDK